jgi:transposase-like protein
VVKQRVGRHPMEFRRMVVERMKRCNNITALAKELGLERKLMYTWRDQLEPVKKEAGAGRPPAETREAKLEREVSRLKRVLADKALEIDFFKGALQKVEAQRQQRGLSGAKASTTKSGK